MSICPSRMTKDCNMSKNLWPDFDSGKGPRSPKGVIEEAGLGLAERTDGRVSFWPSGTRIKDKVIQIEYGLFCQPLAYIFPFLVVQFSMDSMYPVSLIADKIPEVAAKNEEALIASLTDIFNAPATV